MTTTNRNVGISTMTMFMLPPVTGTIEIVRNTVKYDTNNTSNDSLMLRNIVNATSTPTRPDMPITERSQKRLSLADLFQTAAFTPSFRAVLATGRPPRCS